MIRLKRLSGIAISLVFFITAISFGVNIRTLAQEAAFYEPDNAETTSGDYKTDGTASSLLLNDDTRIYNVGPETPPASSCPDSQLYFENRNEYDSMDICFGASIYDTITVMGNEFQSVITVEMISGPGSFFSTPSIPPAYGYYEYTPDSEGAFDVTFLAYNDKGDSITTTRTYIVFQNNPPVITTGDTSLYNCYDDDFFAIFVEADDLDNDPIVYRVLSDNGYIDSITGYFRFWTDIAGENCHIFEASDGCSADTAVICVNALWNTFPTFNNPDQKFNICAQDSICLDISVFDPDTGDSIIIVQESGPGSFTMTSDTGGVTCFLPADVDSAEYVFIYYATDNCLRGELPKDVACPPIPYDTVVITVIIGEGVVLDCPDDSLSIFICQPDTICIPIGNIPDETGITVSPPSAWYNADNESICFYTNCSVEKDIKIVVESGCGPDSCMFSVDVTLNSAPLVILPPDTSIFLCESEEICIPAGITDIDGNIENIIISEKGSYNSDMGRVCFTPSTSGNYNIVVTAIDSCGAQDTDSMNVNVTINSTPALSLPSDTSVSLCNPEQICIDVFIDDVDYNLFNIIVSPLGFYDSQNGRICFTPDTGGVYTIVVTAIDLCGAEAFDSINVNVNLGSSPVVVSSPDTAIFMCELNEYCFPVSVTDPDDDIVSVQVIGEGIYSNGYVCFTPSAPGEYTFVTEAVDGCDNQASDTTIITILLNSPPQVVSVDDFGTLCYVEEICFDVSISDPDDNLYIVSTNQNAVYDSAKSGYLFYYCDCYRFLLCL